MRLMITDPRTNAAREHRWVLWLFLFVGVVLHSSLCPPNVHAGVLSATTRMCVSSDAEAPAEVARATEVPDTGRAGDAGRPCAPAPRHHHHSPCGVMNHRGSSGQRANGPGPATMPACPGPFAAFAGAGERSRACARDRSSRPPAPRSGAGLLIDLCSSRT